MTQGCRGTIWVTGLSASGKSTLALGLQSALAAEGLNVALLDGEDVRARLPRRYGFTLDERAEVTRHILDFADTEAARSDAVIVATISHLQWLRDSARTRLTPFFEVFLDCPPEICATRDTKGHYARAFAGEYDCFIGVTHPYERLRAPDLILDCRDSTAERILATALPPCRSFLGL